MQNLRLGRVHLLIFFAAIFLASCATSKRTQVYRGKLEQVVTTSKQYIGTPYRYGGNTKSGIDCSGLVCRAYESIDYNLPRTSADQSKVGKKVKVRKLKEGDLLFFAMSDKKRKITHVGMVTGIYRDGITFIHASSSRGVIEKNLLDEYYITRLRRARRVIAR